MSFATVLLSAVTGYYLSKVYRSHRRPRTSTERCLADRRGRRTVARAIDDAREFHTESLPHQQRRAADTLYLVWLQTAADAGMPVDRPVLHRTSRTIVADLWEIPLEKSHIFDIIKGRLERRTKAG